LPVPVQHQNGGFVQNVAHRKGYPLKTAAHTGSAASSGVRSLVTGLDGT
jgi:hypothetical protein